MERVGPEKQYTLLARILTVLLPICLIAGGAAGFMYLKSQKAKMKRRPPKKHAVMVETRAVHPAVEQGTIRVMGIVEPEIQVTLKARVTGEVTDVSPACVQGGLLKKGDLLVTIDDSDYTIEVKKARAALDKALAALDIEQGSQEIAREEFRLIREADIGEINATDLSLRKPQLIQARTAVASARAELEKARLNLSRTRIVVPFNALVLEKKVEKGSLVNVQGELAVLVNVDAWQVRALVPPDRLPDIVISETSGSEARVVSSYSGLAWKGRVVRTTGSITADSRMAGVIIRVPDPLGRKASGQEGLSPADQDSGSRLLLDDHVRVNILGRVHENVYSISRADLHEGNTVWIFKDGKLDIRTVEPVWKEDGRVLVRSGIAPGDLLVVTDLPAPVNGMSLRRSQGAE